MWSAKAHEAKRVCLRVKHTFTNGGECKRLSLMILKWIPTLGIALMRESQMFRTLIKKVKKYQMKPQGCHWRGFEMWMLKVLSHCPFRHEMHELWCKKRSGIKFGIWLSTINPLKEEVKSSPIGVCNTTLEDILRSISYCLHMLKKNGFEIDMNI